MLILISVEILLKKKVYIMFHIKKLIIGISILIILCFGLITTVNASDITINPKNSTLSSVINKYDTIYLADGVYNGASNRNINISRNTTIIGLNKGGAIIDDEYKSSLFKINHKTSLLLINLTFVNKFSSINNHGSLTVRNSSFTNNQPFQGIIRNRGSVRIYDSSFNNNENSLIYSFTSNDIIRNCNFTNNHGGIDGIITFLGENRNISLTNLLFSNNSASTGLIVIKDSHIIISISKSSFINSKGNIFVITGEFEPSIGSKIISSNITEINTNINYNPYIDVKLYLKKNSSMTFKTTLRDAYGMILPNQRLYFYSNDKLIGSPVTDKNGVATLNYKKTNLDFTIQILLKAKTVKNSTTTAIFKRTFLKETPSKLIVGKSNIVFKLISTKKKGKLIYKRYYIYNKGNSLGSKTITKKISSKYNLVKSSHNKMTFKYNKSTKTFSIKVKNFLPYEFNKKTLGVLTLVLY